MPDYKFEQSLIEARSALRVCGVDEAGRGPCAGPVAVAAVILDPSRIPEGIADSKTLSESKRFQLEPLIKSTAIAWQVVMVSAAEIDRMNILSATLWGMTQAVEGLVPTADHALIDGNCTPKLEIPAHCLIKGDSRSLSIAAASILAKTARDRYMIELDRHYPAYGFAAHKGYQAKNHIDALKSHGPCPEHRLSWASLKNL